VLPECHKNFELIRSMRLVKEAVTVVVPQTNTSEGASSSSATEVTGMCNICQELPSVLYCIDYTTSQSVCQVCFDFRHSSATMSTHSSETWTLSHATVFCKVHPDQPCVMYCKQDNAPVCTMCVVISHKGHELCIPAEEKEKCEERLRVGMQVKY
jgi:hypothetical protein